MIAEAPEFKLCLVGDTGVGKTCIANRFVSDEFHHQQASSSSASFFKKTVNLEDRDVRLQIWDTAGQEAFRALAPMYYRSAAAIFVVFDLTRTKTFEDVKYWIGEIKNKANSNVIVYIIGNKSDLRDYLQVSDVEAHEFALYQKCRYFSCSACTGDNVAHTFEEVSVELLALCQQTKKTYLLIKDSKDERRCC